MITKQIKVKLFEPGDVLDITDVKSRLSTKWAVTVAEIAIVLRTRLLGSGEVTYDVLLISRDEERLQTYTKQPFRLAVLLPDEHKDAKYLGAIEISLIEALIGGE
ncbi:MAG: hypothetical protein LUD72_07010 [Bacteroidales bacterium]|nr:hypothetical protein [Bacteroidales bacterium]